MKKVYAIIIGICIGFMAQGQEFTVFEEQGIVDNSISDVIECGEGYTFSFTTDESHGKVLKMYNNGAKLFAEEAWKNGVSGMGFEGALWNPENVGRNDGGLKNTKVYCLINVTNKTTTFSTDEPDCSTDPTIKSSKESLSFSTCKGIAQSEPFEINGEYLLDDITLTIEGENAADYELTNMQIAKGSEGKASATIDVTLKATAAGGQKKAKIVIQSDGADSKEITLFGEVKEKKIIALPSNLIEFTPACAESGFEPKSFTIKGECLSDDVTIIAAKPGFSLRNAEGNDITNITAAEIANGVTVYLHSSAKESIENAVLAITLESTELASDFSVDAIGTIDNDILQVGSLSGSLDYFDCTKCTTTSANCVENPAGSISVKGYCLQESVTITAPENFEVFDGENWVNSFSIDAVEFNENIPVRLKAGLAANNIYNGEVRISQSGENSQTVPVEAKSLEVEADIKVDKNTIVNQFGVDGKTAQKIEIVGENLTKAITATAPAGFEIATSEAGPYGATQSLSEAGGAIWVRPTEATVAVNSLARGNVTFSSDSEIQTMEVIHGAKEVCSITENTTIPENEVWTCSGNLEMTHDVTLTVEGELQLPAGFEMKKGTLHVKPTGAVIIQEQFILTNGDTTINNKRVMKKVEVINEGRMELHGTSAKGEFHMATKLLGVNDKPNASANGLYFTNKGVFGVSNAVFNVGQNEQNGGAAFYNHTDAIVNIDNEDYPDREVYLGGKGDAESVLFTRPNDKITAEEQQASEGNFNSQYVSMHFHDDSHFVVKNTDVNTLIGQPGDGRQEIAGEFYVYDGNMDIGFQGGSGGQAPTISGGLYVIDQTPSDCNQKGMVNIKAAGGNMEFIVEGNLWATGLNGENTQSSGSNAINIKPGGTGFIGNVGANMPSDNYKIHVEEKATLYYCGNYSEFGDAVGTVAAGGTLYYAPTYYEDDNETNPTDTNDAGGNAVVVIVAGVDNVGVNNNGGSYKIEVLAHDADLDVIKAYLTFTGNNERNVYGTWTYPKTYSLCDTCTSASGREFFKVLDNGSFEIHTYKTGDFTVEKGATSEEMKDFEGNEISSAEECEKLFLTPPQKPKDFSWLPVTLTKFQAAATPAGGARIEWATQTETNNDYFTLYRSYNGIVFEAIAHKSGAGTTTNPQMYDYNDNDIIPNIAYYKLEQTDYNGETTMSNVVAVQNLYLSTFEIETMQNNGNGNYSFSFLFPDNERENHIVIYNIMSVKRAEYTFAAGNISAQADANLYPGGTYIVEHTNGVRKTIKKIVVK